MSIKCKILGHNWSGKITGFAGNRPIGRCSRCDIPLISKSQRLTAFAQMCYEHGMESDEVEERYQRLVEEGEIV